MALSLAIPFGLFGLIVGSFLNVLILRSGTRSLGGRSACMSCGQHLRWFDLAPVLSWLVLRGHCRMCGARISVQYPLVEATTGLVFALIGGAPFSLDLAYRLLYCAIAALLIAIAVYDIRHTLIPDLWAYTLMALSVVTTGSLIFVFDRSLSFLVYLLAGPLSASPIFLLWLVSRGAWMGFGDVKLALSFGWLLGPVYGVAAVFLAFIIGAVVSVGILLPLPHIVRTLERLARTLTLVPWRILGGPHDSSTKSLNGAMPKSVSGFTMKSEIPFGPFLSASCLILLLCWLYGIDALRIFGF
jgi:leader peptidase (prepilin peptidase)/N-methyltransferase